MVWGGRSGSYSARLTYDVAEDNYICQALPAFPSDVVTATVTFWMRATTTETEAGYDALFASLYHDGGDGYIYPTLALAELDATASPAAWSKAVCSFDSNSIGLVKGTQQYILIEGFSDDSGWATQFYVDDVSVRYDTAAPAATRPFRASLAWTDYPGIEGAGTELVNDLDLEIVSPTGTRYYGNNATLGSRDRKNNVETVWLADGAPAGTWQVIVKAPSVPQGPQPYALVVSGSDLARLWTGPSLYLPLVLRSP